MKENLTELVLVLDESGSMYGLRNDTIGGFNSMIEKQKSLEGECLVTTVLFNNSIRTIHDRIDLKKVLELTNDDYRPFGCTALIDAVYDTITKIESIHKYIRKEDVPEKTIFIITTDGLENASHKYSSSELKDLITKKKNEGWEFMFLAANIDTFETAKSYGMSTDDSVTIDATPDGIMYQYCAMDSRITNVRVKPKQKIKK